MTQLIISFSKEEDEIIEYYSKKWDIPKYLAVKNVLLKYHELEIKSKKLMEEHGKNK